MRPAIGRAPSTTPKASATAQSPSGESEETQVEAPELLPPPDLAKLALQAARVVDADYAGVDLLPHDDGGYFVLEVNGIPGWQGLQRTTTLDVAGTIADHLLARLRGGADGGPPAIGPER